MSLTHGQIISEMKASGLRGRGGAGFPSGLKWVREQQAICIGGYLQDAVVHEHQGLGKRQQAPLPGG